MLLRFYNVPEICVCTSDIRPKYNFKLKRNNRPVTVTETYKVNRIFKNSGKEIYTVGVPPYHTELTYLVY